MKWIAAPVFVLASLVCSAPAHAELGLRETLQSAVDSHPYARVAEAKLDAAEGRLRSARGEFDLKAYAEGRWAPVGTYEKPYGEVGLSQPTALWGTELKASYRNGADYQVYDGRYVTSELGEAALQVLIPILRGGAVDDRRMQRIRARINQAQAEQEVRQIRVDILAGASSSWWKWAIVGKKRGVYEALFELAEDRRSLLAEQIGIGAVAAIEGTDNQRLVASRRASALQQELVLRRSALKLGLYRRNDEGRPLPPESGALPEQLPGTAEPSSALLESALREAEEAPRVRLYRLAADLLQQEARLARNAALPRLDFGVKASQGMGDPRPYAPFGDSLSETKVLGMLGFELDVQRRKALGKVAELEAKQNAVESELDLILDGIQADIRAAFAALQLGHEQVQLNRVATEAAETLAEAERERLSLGQSSILNVNLREQAVLSARLAELDALLDFHLAWIDLQATLGRESIEDFVIVSRGEAATP